MKKILIIGSIALSMCACTTLDERASNACAMSMNPDCEYQYKQLYYQQMSAVLQAYGMMQQQQQYYQPQPRSQIYCQEFGNGYICN